MLVALTSLLLISQAAVADSINGFVDFAARIQVDSAIEGHSFAGQCKSGRSGKGRHGFDRARFDTAASPTSNRIK